MRSKRQRRMRLNNSVASGADILRNFGAITVGVVVGQVAFKAIMAGAQAAMGAFSNAVSPAIERTLGFQNASNALVKTIAEQTRALSGQEKVAVAQTVAQSGLSDAAYATVRPFLEQRAAVEANNKAYEEQNVLLAAGRNIQFQNARFQTNAGTKTAAGLPEGVSPGLFQATGGANVLGVQTPFGSQAPFEEGLRERLAQIPDFTSAFTGGGVHFGPATLFQPPEYQGVSLEDRLSNREKTLTSVLGDLQDDFKNTGIEWVRSTDAMAASTDDATKYLQAAGIQLTPGQLAEQGVSVSQATLGLSPADFQLGLQQASQQAATPSTDALLAAAEPQLKALRFGIENNLKNQLEIYLPAQRAIQRAAQPIQPLTAGLLEKPGTVTGLGESGRFAGVPPAATASFGRYQSEAQRAIDAVNAKAAEGERVLTETLGVPQSTLDGLKNLGNRIAALTTRQREIQLDAQYSAYNHQLFIAERTLGDLAGLTGRQGATQVGNLQREQLLLGRKTQALQLQGQLLGLQSGQLQQQSSEIGYQANQLQLAQSQRQINFQRATAGFTAPGLTPEERAARIEEAKIEADFA